MVFGFLVFKSGMSLYITIWEDNFSTLIIGTKKKLGNRDTTTHFFQYRNLFLDFLKLL